jgi:hypothetical protein
MRGFGDGSRRVGPARVGPATVIATLALFVAIGGSATAAGLINGKDIKPGTVTAKQLKNKAVTKAKLAPSAVAALRGPAGPAGAPGQPGQDGQDGQDGVVSPLTATTEYAELGGDHTILSLEPAPGAYLITAKATLTAGGAYTDGLSCSIWTDGTDAEDTANQSPVAMNDTVSLSLMAVASPTESIELRCDADSYSGTGNVRWAKLFAVPIQD